MIERTGLIVALLLFCAAGTAAQETQVNGRRAVVMDGEAAQLVVDMAGGSIADFQFQDQGLNPLDWNRHGEGTQAHSMGHFLCLDRWASASQAESANGMPGHGEASNVEWKLLRGPAKKDDFIEVEMQAVLPLAGLQVRRWIRLSQQHAFVTVREEVTNTNKLGRIYNMVQHPTIGPPFLDETTVVDANAHKGFMAYSPLPDPEDPEVYWPQAINLNSGQSVDMRYLADDQNPTNAGYTFEEEYGWTTASTAGHNLLIGYMWKTEEYPWFNVWRATAAGKPVARGLEFGTTGLPLPPAVLVAKGKIFDRPLFEYIDAGQTVSRVYAAFLFAIPADYSGTERVAHADGLLRVRARDTSGARGLVQETASGHVRAPDKDLLMEVEKLFIE